MKHKKIKKQIKKVSSFFESISADDDISKIEKDLLLSYVRKLYEAVLDHDNYAASEHHKEIKKSKPAPAPAPEPAATPKAEKKVTPKERKPFERAETSISEVKEVKTAAIQEEVQVESAKVKAPVVKEVVVEAAPVISGKSSNTKLSENMSSIFEKSGGTEISDRLSNLPIKDLTKAMGINERMFTIQELFGGNQDKFKSVMSAINKLGGYEEAKEYLLSGVATELEWDSEAKYKKADKFVKLVQRRFS